jgi:hypothetical protein
VILRSFRIYLVLACALLCIPAVAQADSPPVDGHVGIWNNASAQSELRIDFGPGATNYTSLHVTRITATHWQIVDDEIANPALPVPDGVCAYANVGTNVHQVDCTTSGLDDVVKVVAYFGDGNDWVFFNGANVPADLYGEKGDDVLLVRGQGVANDRLYGDYAGGDQAGDGNDYLTGGCGVDQYFGGGGADAVTFTNDQCAAHAAGVAASLDDVANDPDGENIGGASNSVENLHGTFGNDTLSGSALPNEIYANEGTDAIFGGGGDDILHGGAGDDEITGGAGRDMLYGDEDAPWGYPDTAPGNDTIGAEDGEADTVECAGGSGDVAIVDESGDTVNTSTCESVRKPSGTSSDDGPVVLINGVPVSVEDVTNSSLIPNVRGALLFKGIDRISNIVKANRGGNVNFDMKPIYIKRKSLPKLPKHKAWVEGMIYSNALAGKTAVNGPGQPVQETLKIWMGEPAEAKQCLAEAKQLISLGKGPSFPDFEKALNAIHCNVDDVKIDEVKTTSVKGEDDFNSGDRCEIATAVDDPEVKKPSSIDVTMRVPKSMALTDLRLVVEPVITTTDGVMPTLLAPNWDLEAKTKVQFAIKVYARSGNPVNNVRLYADATSAGGRYQELVTRKDANFGNGVARFEMGLSGGKSSGQIEIAAMGTVRKGKSRAQSVCGYGVIPVRTHTDFTKNDVLDAVDGTHYVWTGSAWKETLAKSKGSFTSNRLTGSFTATASTNIFQAIWNGIVSIFSGRSTSLPSKGTQQQKSKSMSNSGVNTVLLLNGSPAGATSKVALISQDGAGIVAQGGGNLIGQDGAGIVASGAGNALGVKLKGGALIGQDGAGIVAQGGGNLTEKPIDMKTAQIASVKGVALIGQDGAGLIGVAGSGFALAGDHLISQDGAG